MVGSGKRSRFGRSVTGIGGRVASVSAIGIAGMLLVGFCLHQAMNRLAETAASVEKAQRIAAQVGSFSNALGQARIEFESFKSAAAASTLDPTEALLLVAAGRVRRLEVEAAGTPLTPHLAQLQEMMGTIGDSIRQIIPERRRSGPGSIENLRLVLEDRVAQVAKLRAELREAPGMPRDEVARLAVANSLADVVAVAAEAGKAPDAPDGVAMTGVTVEVAALARGLLMPPAQAERVAAALDALDKAFAGWVSASVAMRNDTAITSGVFDIVTPVVARLTEENAALVAAAQAEAQMIKAAARAMALTALLVGLALAAAVSWMIGRSITRPIAAIRDAMKRVAGGAMHHAIPFTNRGDEIGSMARSVQVFQAAMLERQALTSGQLAEAEKRESRGRAMADAAHAFDGALSRTRDDLARSSERIAAFAASLSTMAGSLDGHARASMDAVTGTAAQTASVASATDELAQSIAEIAAQTQRANGAVLQAVQGSQDTEARMLALKERAGAISSIVEIINSVAAQTNLLALNATIEAARAGQAGRGFAVVANEIKALADQTAKATAEIGQRIEGIQTAASEGAGAVGALARLLALAEEASIAVAAAVRQQDYSVAEIARIMSDLSSGAAAAEAASSRTFAETERATAMAESMRGLAESVAGVSAAFSAEAQRFMGQVEAA